MSEAKTLHLVGQTPVIHSTPYNGNKIYKTGNMTNGSKVLYTVPESSILWIYNYYLDAIFTGIGLGYLAVFDDSASSIYSIDVMRSIATTNKHATQLFQPPLVIESGLIIKLVSGSLNVTMEGGIFGYLFGV